MKNNLKKLSSLALAVVLVLAFSVTAFAADITSERAKEIALGHFGVKAEDVKFLEVRKDYDDGRSVYEIEFCKPYSEKFSCEVAAANGLVRDGEREAVRGVFDKLELFFELLILAILGR